MHALHSVRSVSVKRSLFVVASVQTLAVSPWLNATTAASQGAAPPLVVATRADDCRGRARSGLAPQPWCWACSTARCQTPASSAGRRPGVLKEPEPPEGYNG